MRPAETVGPDDVKEAAKEAVQGVGYDLLVVCGFAFDPHVSEEVKRYGKLEVEVRGVDVYDPTTQEIRSHSIDDIACWLIDTAYNGESFFVRHAYFTSTSRPFDRPKTGKIAVKVINHYGDEVLKVFRTE